MLLSVLQTLLIARPVQTMTQVWSRVFSTLLSSLMPSVALSVVLSVVLTSRVCAAEDSATDARAWLERMSTALATRNYDVRFIHIVGSRVENMRIIHRVAENASTERLISLDGNGRELVRTDTEVVRYLPDRRSVLVERRTDSASLLGTVPLYNDNLQANYLLAAPGNTRILGRLAQFIVVQPRDHFRYGYRLWLDQETAMPLKSQLCDREGRVIEQIVFSELLTPTSIDAALLKPSMSIDGFKWIRQAAPLPDPHRSVTADASMSSNRWIVLNPPQGFRLTVTRIQNIAGASGPVRHLVLSDGLASVSVFIEPVAPSLQQQRAEPNKQLNAARTSSSESGDVSDHAQGELARVGSALAYSVEAYQHRITVVGEVPATTLRAIATAVQRETAPSSANDNPNDSARRPSVVALGVAPK